MADITAGAVKSLRERTGAGMMDCKRALQEADGDEERAIDLLRQRGEAKAATRAGRETSEGVVHIALSGAAATMVEVQTETDFVARSKNFTSFAEHVAEEIAGLDLPDGEILTGEQLLERPGGDAIGTELNELRLKVGENVQLARVVGWSAAPDATLGSYLHFGSRIGVLVELSGADGEASTAAKGVAMHVAAANPIAVSPDDLPDELVERERHVLVEQAKAEGKPDHIAEKMVEGRLRKFFEQSALLWQPYVRDPDKTVKEMLEDAGADLQVRRFVRFEVGA
jgi:elongation factor Ts